MKTPKPGQFTVIGKVLCRAYKRTDGCKGCIFDNAFSCPRITYPRNSSNKFECLENGIILKRI